MCGHTNVSIRVYHDKWLGGGDKIDQALKGSVLHLI